MSKKIGKALYPLPFLLPFLSLFVLFLIVPVILLLWMSLTDFDVKFNPTFVGLSNIIKILKDINLPNILMNTAQFIIIPLAIIMTVSIMISILTQYFLKNKTARYIYRMIWLAMNSLPTVVFVLFIKWMFDGSKLGILNGWLLDGGAITQPVQWFSGYAMLITACAYGFFCSANGTILLSAGINAIPEDYYKAARIDGAADLSIVFDIILPILRWPIMYTCVSNSISLLSAYGFVLMLTKGGPARNTMTLALYAYQNAFVDLKYGYGAAISLIVIFIALILVILQMRIFNLNDLVKKSRIEM